MKLKDKKYLANIYGRITASVNTVNEKIDAHRGGKASIEGLLATVALEQLATQHDILIALATLVFEPGPNPQPLPELPKKIIGFK